MERGREKKIVVIVSVNMYNLEKMSIKGKEKMNGSSWLFKKI